MPHDPTVHTVRGRIADARRERRIGAGLATLAPAALVWLATLAGIVVAPWWLQLPLAVANGLAICVLFLAGHDAGHGTLFHAAG